MTPLQAMRAAAAEERRQHRAAQIRQRELAKQIKEQAKLSTQQQARLEVDALENALEVLLSVHKGGSPALDWRQVLNEPPPLPPVRQCVKELLARWEASKRGCKFLEGAEDARGVDEAEFRDECGRFHIRMDEWHRLRGIAGGVLGGDGKAYIDALLEMNPFEEIRVLGSALHFTVHSRSVLEANLKVSGKQTIPAEIKSLTSSGKLSVKSMPRVRFQEIYQDYVCSCALRVAREVFALLPVDLLLLTALAERVDPGTGKAEDQPVLSVVFGRAQLEAVDFERIDSSDAVERFQHRGDFKASRKLEAFAPIVPLTPADLPAGIVVEGTFDGALAAVQAVRAAVSATRQRSRPAQPVEIEAPVVE